jgi:hypothetical protein
MMATNLKKKYFSTISFRQGDFGNSRRRLSIVLICPTTFNNTINVDNEILPDVPF